MSLQYGKVVNLNKLIIKQFRSKNIGNYYLREIIGTGGFADVVKGVHIKTGEQVAIKIIKKQNLSADQLIRVRNQIEIQSKLYHVNIARIYEVINTTKKIYIVMEYLSNGQLFGWIQKKGKMTEMESAKIFVQILNALIYMHQQNITHRDIKVENIILDSQLNAKLIDFGLSKRYQVADMNHTICGSPCYLAPQIIREKSYSPQLVDVWCLGVVLYVMLNRSYPFQGKANQISNQSLKIFPYNRNSIYSSQCSQVFNRIFVKAEKRISLKQLKSTEFVKKYSNNILTNSINTLKQKIYIDQSILQEIQICFNVSPSQIKNSLLTFKLDSNSSLYYLIIKRRRLQGKSSPSDLQSLNFKKQTQHNFRVRSLEKVKRLSSQKKDESEQVSKVKNDESESVPKAHLTPKKSFSHRKNSQCIQLIDVSHNSKLRTSKRRPQIKIQQCRLRRTQSPQSPKRILDWVESYHKNLDE